MGLYLIVANPARFTGPRFDQARVFTAHLLDNETRSRLDDRTWLGYRLAWEGLVPFGLDTTEFRDLLAISWHTIDTDR